MTSVKTTSLTTATQLLASGKARQAAELLAPLVKLHEGDVDILRLHARSLYESEQLLPALKACDRLAQLGAADADDWFVMGTALFDLGEHAQAVGALERSIRLDGKNPEAHHKLAWACFRLGDIDRSVKHLEIIARKIPIPGVQLSLAVIIPNAPSASQKKILMVRTQTAREMARCNEALVSLQQRPVATSTSLPRIAYLSSWFDSPNYMKPVWGLVNHHDRAHYRVHLICDCDKSRPLTGYEKHAEDRLHFVKGKSNEQLAELISEIGIDILVDLNGYSEPDRLALFLSKPAPVTLAWFNMYATSGLPGFDYILGDAEVVQPKEDRLYTEQVIRLPLSYLTFEVGHSAPPVVEPPCVKNDYLTFGSLVAQYKMTPDVMDVWAKILRKARGSRLFIANTTMKSIHNRDWLKQCFVKRGVDAQRIEIAGPAEHYQYLEYYNSIDIALDAWPYNGGTTTMEALWQGVPVLTIEGDRWAARTSQTLLRRTHLKDCVCRNSRALIKKAASLTHDKGTPDALRVLRREMRDRLLQSDACDTVSFARAMEAFYSSALHQRRHEPT